MTRHLLRYPALAMLLLGLTACAGSDDDNGAPSGPRSTPVTTTEVVIETVHIREQSLGSVHTTQAPTVASEVGARVIALHADEGRRVEVGELLAELDAGDFELTRDRSAAETERLSALIDNQQRQVERNQRLLDQKLIAENIFDDSEAELRALRGQLAAERATLAQAERNIRRTRITAPVGGRIETRMIDVGDWTAVGAALFHIATDEVLRARLPYPEHIADRLRPGLTVELSSPAAPGRVVDGTITELRPMIGATRAVMVLAEFDNPGDWRAGASVNGAVIVETREDAILVPEISVVHRPVGQVVYLVDGEQAVQRVVRPGHRQNGRIEILEGLDGGERIVVDGAGFMTDGARISIRDDAS